MLDWDHNAYYHGVLLKHLPSSCDHVLDVGCGAGALAVALASRASHVDALDRSPAMLDEARRVAPANVTCVLADVLRDPLPEERYDAIVSMSALHHMQLEHVLPRLDRALRPGGVLAAAALPRRDLLRETPAEVCAGIGHRLYGAAFLMLRASGRGRWYAKEASHAVMPVVMRPPLTTRQVRQDATRLLPGAQVSPADLLAVSPAMAQAACLMSPDDAADAEVQAAIAGELRLLEPAVRRDPRQVDALLHPDFFEFGASGHRWERREIIDLLAEEDRGAWPGPGGHRLRLGWTTSGGRPRARDLHQRGRPAALPAQLYLAANRSGVARAVPPGHPYSVRSCLIAVGCGPSVEPDVQSSVMPSAAACWRSIFVCSRVEMALAPLSTARSRSPWSRS